MLLLRIAQTFKFRRRLKVCQIRAYTPRQSDSDDGRSQTSVAARRQARRFDATHQFAPSDFDYRDLGRGTRRAVAAGSRHTIDGSTFYLERRATATTTRFVAASANSPKNSAPPAAPLLSRQAPSSYRRNFPETPLHSNSVFRQTKNSSPPSSRRLQT